MMANYDPRLYHQMHPSLHHPSMMAGMGPERFPHPHPHPHALGHGASAPSQPPGAPGQGPRPGSRTPVGPEAGKKKAGPGWEHTYRVAQRIPFPESRAACGERLGEVVEEMAKAVGCPVEYVLSPLLPCVGGLLGTSTSISVHPGWTEPPVVWSIVGAAPGSRRSAVIRQLLNPILALQQDRARMGKNRRDQEEPPRALYSGTRITLAALTEVLHRNDGHAFSLTENVENLHEMLGLLQPLPAPRLVSVLDDLYEGLPLVAVEDGRVTTILGSSFCHGGFASPEYVVTMMLKCPSWLSARMLLSCPQADDMKGVFGEPNSDADLPDLGSVYTELLDRHKGRNCYKFEAEAVQELSRFFDEEWSSVLNQMDQNEHEAIIGKSLGQIVRISGILKALDNAIQAVGLGGEEGGGEFEWDWVVDVETVKSAVTLGKYFLEQKLAMTFMVGTGFFNTPANGAGQDNPHHQQHSNNNGNNNSTTPNGCHGNGSFPGSPTTLPQTAFQEAPDQFPPLNNNAHFPVMSGQALPPSSNSSSSSSSSKPDVSSSHIPAIPHPGATAMSHQQAVNSLYELPKKIQTPGDVDYSTLPQTMTTMEEDVSEMMQAIDFVHFSKTQFVAVHGRRIKRLLECYDDGHGVSATTAAQKSITPPVRIQGTNNRHPAWASALFFQKVADLGLGIAEQGRHPTNRKVCWRFKRRQVGQLSEKDFQLLQYLRVEMDKYSQFGSGAFNPTMMVNAGLINLSSNSDSPPHLPSTSPSHMPQQLDDESSNNSQSNSPRGSINLNIKAETYT